MTLARRAQSLVEFAILVPFLLLIVCGAWDVGGLLRSQLMLQGAARAAAQVAATGYGTTVSLVTIEAAANAAAPGFAFADVDGTLIRSWPDGQSVQVVVIHDQALNTPLIRRLFGDGTGIVRLQASAVFFQPSTTPIPATVVTSTLPPTATPTATPTPG